MLNNIINRKTMRTLESLGNAVVKDCKVSINIDELAKVPGQSFVDGSIDDVVVVFPELSTYDVTSGDVITEVGTTIADLYDTYFDFLYLRSDEIARAHCGERFFKRDYSEFFPSFAKLHKNKKVSRPVGKSLRQVYSFELHHLCDKELSEIVTQNGNWDLIPYEEFECEFDTSHLDFIPDFIGYENDSPDDFVYAITVAQDEGEFPRIIRKNPIWDVLDKNGQVISLGLM